MTENAWQSDAQSYQNPLKKATTNYHSVIYYLLPACMIIQSIIDNVDT